MTTTTSVDFKRTLDSYRARQGEFRTLDVPERQYLAIDGSGDPNASPEYRDAVEAIYPVAYGTKFLSKRELGRDYVVPPLEGLWWADDMAAFTARRDKAQWHWTLLIMTPDWIEPAVVDAALAKAGRKHRPARLDDVRLQPLAEGTVVQTLHVGSYDDEGEVLARLHEEFIPANGLRMTGRHHEIYLSDPRRVPPAELRTVLRQPVEPAG